MAFKDLREYLASLESRGWLKRIRTPVSRDLEISAIADRAVKAGGPALLFENVEGHTVPVAINLFAAPERMALALGVEKLDDLAGVSGDLLRIAMEPPTGGWMEKLKAIPKLIDAAAVLPKTVSGGPCKEVILKGDAASLDRLPILKCWPQDGGRYITFPLVFTKNPETGRRNCGIYRMQVFDGRTCAMHMQLHKDGRRNLEAIQKKHGGRLECGIALGPDPAVAWAGAVPAPPDVDEMLFAGMVRRKGVEMVKCETVDVEVPASAEIVIEGYVDVNDWRVEGPFGDHTGYYSLEDKYPAFHVTAVTHRKDPVYQTIIVGPPPMEDDWMGYAIERLFLPLLKMQLPEVVDYHMPFEGIFHNLQIVSIRKRFPGHARRVMHAIWGLPQAMFTKVIVVVDGDVNVHDPREVAWKALNHIDPERDTEFVQGPIDVLDHASRQCGYGSKIGIDATKKWPEEGFTRRWPDEIKMSPEIKALVERKWKEMGL